MPSNDSKRSLDQQPAMLDWFGQMKTREREHPGLPAPLLDAISPYLEYTPEQLERGGYMDGWLTAALKAYIRITKAAAELEPLGIHESDLCLLLQNRMKEQLKLKREELRKSNCAERHPGRESVTRRRIPQSRSLLGSGRTSHRRVCRSAGPSPRLAAL